MAKTQPRAARTRTSATPSMAPAPGEIDFETFSADAALLEIHGIAAHPGWAKDVMVNAARLAGRFLAALPTGAVPRADERAWQGFIHPVECAALRRGRPREAPPAGLSSSTASPPSAPLVEKNRRGNSAPPNRARSLDLTFTEQYRNMRYWLEQDHAPG